MATIKKITTPETTRDGVIVKTLYAVKFDLADLQAFTAGATYTAAIATLDPCEILADVPAQWTKNNPTASVALTQFDAEVGVSSDGTFGSVQKFLALEAATDGSLFVNASASGTLATVDMTDDVLTVPNATLSDVHFNTATARTLSIKFSRAGGTFAQITSGELYFYIRTITIPSDLAE